MNLKLTRKRWAALSVVPVLALTLGLAACNNNSGNAAEHNQQNADTTTYEHNQPIPHFNYSQARQNLIDIEAAMANDVQTTTFFINYGVADPIGGCPSIGFGIPDSASLSNPLQTAGGNNDAAIGQMDPYGYYAPTSSAGTFVICLTATGQPYIDRIESVANTYGGPAVWNYTKHEGEMVGAPTAAASQVPAAKTQPGK